MRKLLLLALTAVLLCTGCDAFRRLAGRPTSSELEILKLQIAAQEEARNKARTDSLAAVQKAVEDSLAALEAKTPENTVEGAVSLADYPYRYAIVLGSFNSRENADKLAAKVRKAGFETDLVVLKNGFIAVCVNGTNNKQYADISLDKIKENPLFPDGGWLLKK